MQQYEIDQFINSKKDLEHEEQQIILPEKNQQKYLDLACEDFKYLCYINRKGKRRAALSLVFLSTQNRQFPLVRFDVTGTPHTNPMHSHHRPGETLPCPHVHIAEEGFGTSIAYTLEDLLELKGARPFNLPTEKLVVIDEILSFITKEFLTFINTKNINNFNFSYEQKQLKLNLI